MTLAHSKQADHARTLMEREEKATAATEQERRGWSCFKLNVRAHMRVRVYVCARVCHAL